jgi:hypothetical protein
MIQRALEIEPNFLPARELLIQLHLRSGAMDAAKREYGQIVSRRSRFAMLASDVREHQFLQVSLDRVRSEFERAGVSIP